MYFSLWNEQYHGWSDWIENKSSWTKTKNLSPSVPLSLSHSLFSSLPLFLPNTKSLEPLQPWKRCGADITYLRLAHVISTQILFNAAITDWTSMSVKLEIQRNAWPLIQLCVLTNISTKKVHFIPYRNKMMVEEMLNSYNWQSVIMIKPILKYLPLLAHVLVQWGKLLLVFLLFCINLTMCLPLW